MLIVGYGNPLRGDDGIGPAVIDALERTPIAAQADLVRCHQLRPELVDRLANTDAVLFVDATDHGKQPSSKPGTVAWNRLRPDVCAGDDLSHHLRPESLLALTQELYGTTPRAMLVAVVGESFECVTTLSFTAARAVSTVVDAMPDLLQQLSQG